MGVTDEVPLRAQYIRVIVSEISRITDHLTCVGASAMELGAFTPFLYMLKAREWLFELLEELSGARLTYSYVRIGGLAHDLTPDFHQRLTTLLDKIEGVLVEVEDTAHQQPHLPRPHGGRGGVHARAGASRSACTGPCLRACGVDYDVRKDAPYLVYDRLEFDVPVGDTRRLLRPLPGQRSRRCASRCASSGRRCATSPTARSMAAIRA